MNIEPQAATIVDHFRITGRGVVLALDRLLHPSTPRRVTLRMARADGSLIELAGYVEVICWSASPLRESSAILLAGELPFEPAEGTPVEVSCAAGA